jgi:hypothetical protein
MEEYKINMKKFNSIKDAMLRQLEEVDSIPNQEHAMRISKQTKRRMWKEICKMIPIEVYKEVLRAGIFNLTWEQIERIKEAESIYNRHLKKTGKALSEVGLTEEVMKNHEDADKEYKKNIYEITKCTDNEVDDLIVALRFFE